MIKMAIYLIVAVVLFCGSAAASWFLQKKVLNPSPVAAKTHNTGGESDHGEESSEHGDAAHGGGEAASGAHGAEKPKAGGHGAPANKAAADNSHGGGAAKEAASSHGASGQAASGGAAHGAAAAGHGESTKTGASDAKASSSHGDTAAHGATNSHNASGAHGGANVTNTSFTPNSIPITPSVVNIPDTALPEEVIRFGELMKERERRLMEGEEELELERQRLNLLKADLEAAKQEIQDMQSKMQGDLERASEIITRLDKAREAWKREKEDAEAAKQTNEQSKSQIEDQEVTQLQELSKLLGNLAPESAATLVEKSVNDGELDRVAKALKFLDERKAAKILEGISDSDVQSRVVTAMSKVSKPVERTARRTR